MMATLTGVLPILIVLAVIILIAVIIYYLVPKVTPLFQSRHTFDGKLLMDRVDGLETTTLALFQDLPVKAPLSISLKHRLSKKVSLGTWVENEQGGLNYYELGLASNAAGATEGIVFRCDRSTIIPHRSYFKYSGPSGGGIGAVKGFLLVHFYLVRGGGVWVVMTPEVTFNLLTMWETLGLPEHPSLLLTASRGSLASPLPGRIWSPLGGDGYDYEREDEKWSEYNHAIFEITPSTSE